MINPGFPAVATAICALAALTALVYFRHRRRYSSNLCRKWGLDPATTNVLSSDLGRHGSNRTMLVDGLAGAPDVIFRDHRRRRIVIGEAKSRHLKGRPSAYERYQVTLYCGMARNLYRRDVVGILLYGNGRKVVVGFDPALYRRLLAQLPACRRAMQFRR